MKTKIFYDFEATSVSRDADPISIGLVAVTEKLNPDYKEYRKMYLSTHVNEQNKIPGYIGNKLDTEIKTFYAEFTDFNIDKSDDWVKENVVSKLIYNDKGKTNYAEISNEKPFNVSMLGNKETIPAVLKQWLSQFESIEFWADFPIIDAPMLIDLITEWDYQNKESKGFSRITGEYYSLIEDNYKVGLPKHLPNVKYDQFFDLHTLIKLKEIDTDINREEFAFEDIAFKDDKGELLYNVPIEFSNLGKHNALYDSYVNWQVYNKLMKI